MKHTYAIDIVVTKTIAKQTTTIRIKGDCYSVPITELKDGSYVVDANVAANCFIE